MTAIRKGDNTVKGLMRFVAAFTLQAFVLSTLFFTSPAEIFANEFSILPPSTFSDLFLKFPSRIGKFDRLFSPLSGNQSVFFLHIKDAHASREAQQNIARILTRLRDRKQLDLVLIEGAAGTPMPGRLDIFKDAKANTSYKNDLLKAGLMNGAAYFIASEQDVPSGGLEDPRMYFNHAQIFKRVVEARRNFGNFFDTIEAVMLNTFKNILRMDVFLFLKEWRLQRQKEMSWGRYIPFLIRSAEKFLNLDLSDYRAQILWPNLVRFRHLNALEEVIRPEAVKSEFRRLSAVLSRDRDPALEQTMTLLFVAVNNPVGMIQETPDFRRYAEVLVDACQRSGVLLQEYPNLVRYLAFRIFRSEIESEGMLAETERLEEAVFDKLFTNEKMRKVITAYKDFYTLKRAFRLELNRAESNRFLAMDVEKKIRQFSKIAPGYDFPAEEVIKDVETVKKFYQLAQKRDDAFVTQIRNRLSEARVLPDRPFFIAIVTGGYHAEGLENWLRSEGLPFVGIQPSFKDEPNTERYEKILLGDYQTVDALATAQGAILPDDTARKLMGRADFTALRDAEARFATRYSSVTAPVVEPAKISRTSRPVGRSEIRLKNLGARLGAGRRRFIVLTAIAVAGLLSGCASLSHTELKKTLREAETYELPRRVIAVPAVIHVDSQSLLQRILENDPKVKKAEIEIAIKEIEKDRLKGNWSITTRVAWVDGKPVFSGGVGASIPHVIEGGITGHGVGSLATLAVDLAGSLSSILRGEPMLARALSEKAVQAAELNHQQIIGERYAYYAGIAIEIRKLQRLYETSQLAIRDMEAALKVAEARAEVPELEKAKIRDLLGEWRIRAGEYDSLLKEKKSLLLNLYAPGGVATTKFEIGLRENTLPSDWRFSPAMIEQLRNDATHKNGNQLPPNRKLAFAYKGREAAVVLRELEKARGRFSLGFAGFSFADSLASPSGMSSSEKADIGSAWDRGLDRRTKDKNAAGISGEISFGKAAKVDERISSRRVEVTDAVLADVQRTVEDTVSDLVHQIGRNQDKARILRGELERLEREMQRARQVEVAGRRFVTEDKLAGSISAKWGHRLELIKASAETEQAILKLEINAGVLGGFSWRTNRSELRAVQTFREGNVEFAMGAIDQLAPAGAQRAEIRISQRPQGKHKSFISKFKIFILSIALFVSLATSVFAGNGATDPKGSGARNDAVVELKPGSSGTELGHAYEMYDDFTARILNTIPEGSNKKALQRFAEILRVTIVSEETLRQAQQLFVREVVSKETAETVKVAAVSGPSAVGAGLVKVAATDSRIGDEMSAGSEANRHEERMLPATDTSGNLGAERSAREVENASSRSLGSGALGPDVSRGKASEVKRGESVTKGKQTTLSSEPVVGDLQPAAVTPQVFLLGPGSAGSTQLPAPVPHNQSTDISPVMRILLSGVSGTPDGASQNTNTDVARSPSDSRPDVATTLPVTPQKIAALAESAGTGAGQSLSSKPETVAVAGHDLPVSSSVLAAPGHEMVDSHILEGKEKVHPVLSNVTAALTGIPEYQVKEGDVVPRGRTVARLSDPENAGRIRALETEVALMDAQLADPSLSVAEFLQLRIRKESLEKELRERTYQEELRDLRSSHPIKIVRLTHGQVNQGEVLAHGVQLDAGQIVLRIPIEQADFDSAELKVNGETVLVLRYGLSDFDPLNRQFLLTLDFVSPSGAELGPQCDYTLKLGRLHKQEAADPSLARNKPFHITVSPRESVPVSVPVAPGIPGGIFRALVPEGSIVSAGTPVGIIDASGYQQEHLNAAQGLRKLVGEVESANRQFAAFSPEELRKMNADANLQIASLEGVDPKIVVRAPVSGRVEGLIGIDGQVVVPGQATGLRILNSLVSLGSASLTDSDHLIDVPKGSVREGERVRVRTPLGDVLDGTVFKVMPLADENGLWLSDRDAVVLQVEDPEMRLGDNMPVEVWTGIPAGERRSVPASHPAVAELPLRYESDMPPAVFYRLLRHPDQELSSHSVLAGEGSFRQILSSWKFFFKSPKGLAAMGKKVTNRVFLLLGGGIILWLAGRFVRVATQKVRWKHSKARLHDLMTITSELQYRLTIRFEQQGRPQDKELLEHVIGPINEWARMLDEEGELDHEKRTTILIKAQELASNKHLVFSGIKFWDIDMWNSQIGRDLAIIFGILTVLCVLTARRITEQARNAKTPVELHELQVFQQRLVDYGDIFNESYNLAHHLGAMVAVLDHYVKKLIPGLGPERRKLSFRSWRMIIHNRLVRFFFPVARLWYLISPVAAIHRIITFRSFRSLNRKMVKLGLTTPADAQKVFEDARAAIKSAFYGQVTLDAAVGLVERHARFWRRALAMTGISALFLPMVILIYLGEHWLNATLMMMMGFGTVMLPLAAIACQVGPVLIRFVGPYYQIWERELGRLKKQNRRLERSLPEIPKPKPVSQNPTPREKSQRGSEQIAMSKILRALHDTTLMLDVEVIGLVPPRYGENKAALEQLIREDAVLRQWDITVEESDGEFPGDAGLFFAARNIAKTGQKKFKIYWYPQAGMDFQTAVAVFKINLGEAARMIGELRAVGVQYGEIAFPGGDLVSSSSAITRNGGHFVVQTRYASLDEVESERLPVILGRNGTSRLEIEHIVYQPQKLREMMSAGDLHLGSGRVSISSAAVPQFPVPTGPVAIVAETSEDHQAIQSLLQSTRDRILNLTDRYGPFRINFLEDIVRPVAALSRQIEGGNGVTPPNPNLLVGRTVRLSDDTVISPYDKLYTTVSRFLWNGGNGDRRSFKSEAFIPPLSETFYVSGKTREKLAETLDEISANFPEFVNPELTQRLRQEMPTASKGRFVFRDDAAQIVYEEKETGYKRGLRSEDVAGLVIRDQMIALQRRDHQIGNEPGRLDVSFAGQQDETDQGPEATASREFREELLGGRRPVPEGVVFRPIGSPVQLEITHESEQGLSVRKKNTTVYGVLFKDEFSRDDFLPGGNAVEIIWMTREGLEKALKQTPGRFTARAFQLFTKLGSTVAFSEGGVRSEVRVARTGAGIHMPPAVISLPRAPAVLFQDDQKISPAPQMPEQIRILTAILVAQKILAARDAELLPELEASLRDAARIAERVAPALSSLSGAHDVPIEELKAGLEALLRQEQSEILADDRIVFLDAGTISEEYFDRIANSPFPVVILFDRDHKELYDRLTKESPRATNAFLIYTPDGINSFIRNSLRSGAVAVTASPRLNGILARFREQGKSEDIALIASSRAESQKIEQDYVGHRYYFTDEMLHIDPELVAYSLVLLLRSPELFRYGKGRYAQDVVSLIGLVMQQLAEEFQIRLKTGSAA